MAGRKKGGAAGGAGTLRLRSGQAERGGEGEGQDLCPFCGAPAVGGAAIRLMGSRNRPLQVARTGGRKLFGKERRETFLHWFAATGNLGFAAAQAGVCRQTVSKHRLADPVFEAAYRDAVMLCVPDLQARLHAHLQGQPKLDPAGGLAPPDEQAFDPQLAIQILRELQRTHAGPDGGTGRALKKGQRPRTASSEEVRAALVKRLQVFGVRVREEGLEGLAAALPPAPPPSASGGRSPSPENPGEE